MNTSNASNRSFTIPMPMPSSPASPKPTAPDSPPNEFTKFFTAENADTKLPYPTVRNNHYYLKLDIKREWNAGFAIKHSQMLSILEDEIEAELKSLLKVDDSFKIALVHAQKDRWSSRRILLTLAIQTLVNFSAEKFEAMLKQHIAKEEKIVTTRAYVRDLKLRKIAGSEYEHLIEYGCNPCAVCGELK